MRTNLVDKGIHKLIYENKIKFYNHGLIIPSDVQPATLDIRAGNTAYVLESDEKLPEKGANLYEKVRDISLETIDITKGHIFERDVKYAIPSTYLDLPEHIKVDASAKSTTGRNSVFSRTAFDGHDEYESVPKGGKGTVWLEVIPESWRTHFGAGQPLSQLQFILPDSHVNNQELDKEQILYDQNGQPINYERDEDLTPLSIDLTPNELVGYESKKTNRVNFFGGKNQALDFWEPIYSNEKGEVTLKPDHMYIFGSKENIRIPLEYTAQMAPYHHAHGEFRTNIAGLFDPYFGGEEGCTAVFEIKTFGNGHSGRKKFVDGEKMCYMKFFQNVETPEFKYGDKGNSYQLQRGPRLAKNFILNKEEQKLLQAISF